MCAVNGRTSRFNWYIPVPTAVLSTYFVEEAFEEDPEPMLSADPQMSEDDNVLVQSVSASPYAISFFGYAYYQENQDILAGAFD